MLCRFEPARYHGLRPTFWLVRKDGEDFEVGTELVSQRASELSGESCPNSLRTAQNSRDASRGFFLKFLCLSIQRANEIRCGAKGPEGFPLVNVFKCLR